MRRSVVIAGFLVLVAVVLVVGPSLFLSPDTGEVAPETAEEPSVELVTFEDAESGFWPYLNARESFEKRSPINVVVRGDADTIVTALTEDDDAEWNVTDEEYHEELEDGFLQHEGGHATGINWGEAAGTKRVAYVDPGPASNGYWTEETLQIDDGEYYGQRYHIRLYESPNAEDEWVAMQAHTEHFDWFTLRHRVTGVESAQSHIERDLMALPFVDEMEDVQRVYLGNHGPSDADGWATKVDLRYDRATDPPLESHDHDATNTDSPGPMVEDPSGSTVLYSVEPSTASSGESTTSDSIGLLPGSTGTALDSTPVLLGSAGAVALGALIGIVLVTGGSIARVHERIDDRLTGTDRDRIDAVRNRLSVHHVALFLAMLVVVGFVRFAGIALERYVDVLTMHAIAAMLYPFMALGIPVVAYGLATRIERRIDAALTAASGLAVAFWLDYGYLAVDALPVDVVLQRVLIVVAVGLIAGGAANRAVRESRWNDMLLAGVALWTVVLLAILFGYL